MCGGFDVPSAEISIHAPRKGSDDTVPVTALNPEGISIHAPRKGSDGEILRHFVGISRFQSTLPVRGATVTKMPFEVTVTNFNPRSP